jgi:hypothetical protein
LADDALIAVDPHNASNAAAALSPVTRTLIESAWLANMARVPTECIAELLSVDTND